MTNNKRKERNSTILITSNAYYPNIGGIENSLYHLAQVYYKKGYKVEIVVSNINSEDNNSPLKKYEIIDNIHVHRYTVNNKLFFFLKPFSSLYSFISLFNLFKKIKNNNNVELTISRFHTTTILSKLAGFKRVIYLVPGVVKYQNHPSNLSNKRGLKKIKQYISYYYHVFLQKKAFQYADELAVFSQNMQMQINKCYPIKKNILLVKPGVDIYKFHPISEKEKKTLKEINLIPRDKVVLLGIGRFVKAKGFIYILESLKYLDNFHLVLVGSGEEEEFYHDFIKNNKLENKVTFTGKQKNPVQYYQLADFFIMSSIYEPLGQTILEALSCSLPIIAFDPIKTNITTAISELLPNSNEVIYVQSLDGISLAKTLSKYIGMDLSPIKNNSRKIAVERFSWEILAERLKNNE